MSNLGLSVPSGVGIGPARSRPGEFSYTFPKKLMRNQMMSADSEAGQDTTAGKEKILPALPGCLTGGRGFRQHHSKIAPTPPSGATTYYNFNIFNRLWHNNKSHRGKMMISRESMGQLQFLHHGK